MKADFVLINSCKNKIYLGEITAILGHLMDISASREEIARRMSRRLTFIHDKCCFRAQVLLLKYVNFEH